MTDEKLLNLIGERIADEVEKVAAGRQSNCEEAAKDVLRLIALVREGEGSSRDHAHTSSDALEALRAIRADINLHEDDFHICEACGHQHNAAIKTFDLYHFIREHIEEAALKLAMSDPAGQPPSSASPADTPDLLEALMLADAALSGANMNMRVVERKVRAAIAKATGIAPSIEDHADDCQSHIVDVRGVPDDCTCGLSGRPGSETAEGHAPRDTQS